jgi:hypothetical protein
MSARSWLFSTTILSSVGAVFLSSTWSFAADIYTKAPAAATVPILPAVDGLNWKVEGLGGTLADRVVGGAQGSLSVPLGGQWGLQWDGTVGSFDGRFFGSGGAHWFWRDPSRGLIGLYASHTHWQEFGGLHVTQVAGEGEAYFGRFTLQGVAGVEFGNSQTGITGVNSTATTVTTFFDTFDVKTRFFDKINLAYYLTDNTKVFAGHRYLGGKHALALGGEAALPWTGSTMLSGFIEGRIGENDFHGVWAGIRGYWGQTSKSLIQRHRQDDPISWMPETLFSITNSLTKGFTTVNTVPPVPPDGDADGAF